MTDYADDLTADELDWLANRSRSTEHPTKRLKRPEFDDCSGHWVMAQTALAREVGVAASTIRRFGTAADAEADGVRALIAWTGDAPEKFITGSLIEGTPLADAGIGTIRVDMALVEEGSGSRSTTRTTIQRLANTAQASGRTVASLTRWSAV